MRVRRLSGSANFSKKDLFLAAEFGVDQFFQIFDPSTDVGPKFRDSAVVLNESDKQDDQRRCEGAERKDTSHRIRHSSSTYRKIVMHVFARSFGIVYTE